MNQQYYTILVLLSLSEGGHVVVDVADIDFIDDIRPEEGAPDRCGLHLINSERWFRLAGTAKDALESVNRQRAEQLAALTHAVVRGATAGGGQ